MSPRPIARGDDGPRIPKDVWENWRPTIDEWSYKGLNYKDIAERLDKRTKTYSVTQRKVSYHMRFGRGIKTYNPRNARRSGPPPAPTVSQDSSPANATETPSATSTPPPPSSTSNNNIGDATSANSNAWDTKNIDPQILSWSAASAANARADNGSTTASITHETSSLGSMKAARWQESTQIPATMTSGDHEQDCSCSTCAESRKPAPDDGNAASPFSHSRDGAIDDEAHQDEDDDYNALCERFLDFSGDNAGALMPASSMRRWVIFRYLDDPALDRHAFVCGLTGNSQAVTTYSTPRRNNTRPPLLQHRNQRDSSLGNSFVFPARPRLTSTIGTDARVYGWAAKSLTDSESETSSVDVVKGVRPVTPFV